MEHSRGEILQDIADTQKEIDELELKKRVNPGLISGYNFAIQERKDFIKKLSELLSSLTTK